MEEFTRRGVEAVVEEARSVVGDKPVYLSFDVDGGASTTELGYMLGAGLKIGLGGFGARVDLRDHITPLDADSIDPAVVEILGLDVNTTLHNFELSAALVLSF